MPKHATKKPARIGTDNKPMRYVALWIEDQLYSALAYMGAKNNRSLAGEIRNRLEQSTSSGQEK